MKLRLENLWGRSRPRESLEQEANEELARVSGGGGQVTATGEAAVAGVNGATLPVAGSDEMMPELETVAAEPEAADSEPEAGMDGAGTEAGQDGMRDWQERMAQLRQSRG